MEGKNLASLVKLCFVSAINKFPLPPCLNIAFGVVEQLSSQVTKFFQRNRSDSNPLHNNIKERGCEGASLGHAASNVTSSGARFLPPTVVHEVSCETFQTIVQMFV